MTVKEAVKASKIPIALSGKSIQAAETLIFSEETIYFASCFNYIVSLECLNGVVIVTSHRILFCSALLKSVYSVSFCFEGSISHTEPTRGLVSKTTIRHNDTSATIEGSSHALQQLTDAIDCALVDYATVSPIHIPSDTSTALNTNCIDECTTDSSLPAKNIIGKDDLVKICSACGDRLLGNAHKCPSCKSKKLISVSRNDTAQIQTLVAAGNTSLRSPTARKPLSKKQIAQKRIKDNQVAGIACCPKCGSISLSTNKKGFSMGKAIIGGAIAPVGILAGNIGSNKLIVTCLNCGETFKPGEK